MLFFRLFLLPVTLPVPVPLPQRAELRFSCSGLQYQEEVSTSQAVSELAGAQIPKVSPHLLV